MQQLLDLAAAIETDVFQLFVPILRSILGDIDGFDTVLLGQLKGLDDARNRRDNRYIMLG